LLDASYNYHTSRHGRVDQNSIVQRSDGITDVATSVSNRRSLRSGATWDRPAARPVMRNSTLAVPRRAGRRRAPPPVRDLSEVAVTAPVFGAYLFVAPPLSCSRSQWSWRRKVCMDSNQPDDHDQRRKKLNFL